MEAIQNFDQAISFGLQNIHNPVLDFIMPLFTYLGELGIFWLIIGVALCFTKKYRKYGVMIFFAVAFCYLVGSIVIKPLVERPRPCHLFPDVKLLLPRPDLDDFSFPSGHTIAAFAGATILFLANRKFGIPALVIAGLIGFSRLYVFEHFFTDVLAGAVLGVLCALLVALVFRLLRPLWERSNDTPLQYVKHAACGAVIGIANVIPGVSGGTMAVVLNIYDRLMDAVGSFRRHWKASLKLLIPVLIGAGIGIVALSWVITYLLEHYPLATSFFFIGLILGSIPLIFKRAVFPSFKPINLIPFVLALGVMIGLAFVYQTEDTTLITKLDVVSAIKLFFFPMIAAAAMILPGVSGSMIMVIFGVYNSVMAAIKEMNLIVLIPVALGVLIGIIGGAKVMDIFLKRCPQATFWAILGLIVGSLFALFKASNFTFTLEGWLAILFLVVGTAISLVFSSETLKDKLSQNKSRKKGKYLRKD